MPNELPDYQGMCMDELRRHVVAYTASHMCPAVAAYIERLETRIADQAQEILDIYAATHPEGLECPDCGKLQCDTNH